MKKDEECSFRCNKLDYASDSHGFVLLKLGFNEIRVHYYDSERLFSSSIKVQILSNAIEEIKLYCRSVCVINNMNEESYKRYLIDMINNKNEREWYHIRSSTFVPICFNGVLSSIMLVADDVTNELDYKEDNVSFSTYKALITDYDT